MTFSASDMWLSHVLMGLFTVRGNMHTALKEGFKRPLDGCAQLHELTGIRPRNRRDRTGLTKVARPGFTGSQEQPAFFHISAAEIIAVKPGTFLTSRCLHSICDLGQPHVHALQVKIKDE